MDPQGSYSDRLLRAVAQASEHITEDKGEPPLWPMNIVESLWYLAKYFLREMYLTIEKLRSKGLSEEEIAKLFKTPTRLTYLIHHTEFPIKGLTAEQAVSLFHTIMDYVELYRKEDIYCETWRNILWDSSQVEDALSEYDFVTAESTDDWDTLSASVGRLNATLWMYSEFIHAAKHPYSHEFHGPYPLSDSRQLIVRHYYDLKPVEIWPFLEQVPHAQVLTLEIYSKDIDIGFSFFNHSRTRSSLPLPQALQSFSLAVGENKVPVRSIVDIRSLQSAYQAAIARGNTYVAEYTNADWHAKLLELHYYYLKPHKDILGEDWHPPQHLFDFVRTTPMDEQFGQFMDLVGQAYSG
jgi:hypothetical protein